MSNGQGTAKIVLEAHRDDIQGKIDRLWIKNDKVLEEGERKLLQHMLDKVNEALEWARGIEG